MYMLINRRVDVSGCEFILKWPKAKLRKDLNLSHFYYCELTLKIYPTFYSQYRRATNEDIECHKDVKKYMQLNFFLALLKLKKNKQKKRVLMQSVPNEQTS